MDPDPRLIAAGISLCLLVLAFTSAVDAAFINISRHRLSVLQAENASRFQVVARLMNEPYRFKVTVILLNASMTIAATAFTLWLTRTLDEWTKLGGLAALLLAILVFSEAVPKALVLRNPDTAAGLLARPFNLLATITWPFIALLELILSPAMRVVSGGRSQSSPLVTEEELRMLVNVGEEEGLIEHEEREMIEGIFSFGDTLAREIMVPRVDIVSLDVDADFGSALAAAINHGHSRIPVYESTIDTVVGVLYAKDLLPALRDGQRSLTLRELMRPAYFAPETMKVDDLLRDLQTRKVHMAIVVDEYGGTAGLVTIEDLIEQIVGEIQDEYDTEEQQIERHSDGELLVSARVPIGDINDLTGVELESEESDRIGGFVYEQLGRVPKVGDIVELPGMSIEVVSVQGLRPKRLRIRYQPPLEMELSAGGDQQERVHDEPT